MKMEKVIAARDITYPDAKGRAVVRWKVGEVVDDPRAADAFSTNARELIVNDPKSNKPVKKPSRAGKKK